MRVKRLSVDDGKKLGISNFPNFHKSGSVRGMKRLYYGMNALLVQCGSFIYNVSSEPSIYANCELKAHSFRDGSTSRCYNLI